MFCPNFREIVTSTLLPKCFLALATVNLISQANAWIHLIANDGFE